MPDNWIGMRYQTNEAEILDNEGVKIHTLLDVDGSTFDETIYTQLFAKLGTNILDNMAQEAGSPAPWKIIADAGAALPLLLPLAQRECVVSVAAHSVPVTDTDDLRSRAAFWDTLAPNWLTRFSNTYPSGGMYAENSTGVGSSTTLPISTFTDYFYMCMNTTQIAQYSGSCNIEFRNGVNPLLELQFTGRGAPDNDVLVEWRKPQESMTWNQLPTLVNSSVDGTFYFADGALRYTPASEIYTSLPIFTIPAVDFSQFTQVFVSATMSRGGYSANDGTLAFVHIDRAQ